MGDKNINPNKKIMFLFHEHMKFTFQIVEEKFFQKYQDVDRRVEIDIIFTCHCQKSLHA